MGGESPLLADCRQDGADDGVIPAAFTADAYVEWLRRQARAPRYWRVPHAQHFDAFLVVPGFGDGAR